MQHVLCYVAGALNFRDVMLAYGKLSKQQMAHESGGSNIGFEFAGYWVGAAALLRSFNDASQASAQLPAKP